jgi:N-methylhydantoinase A
VTQGQGKLINIDNGGTLTDICVIDGDRVYRSKTLTTPHDLSQCLFDGLRRASREVYGTEDLRELLRTTHSIRYSTTQGTNALVERKGPRLGLLLGGGLEPAQFAGDAHATGLLEALVGARCEVLPSGLVDGSIEEAAVRAVNALSSSGANRIVVVFGGADRATREAALKRALLRAFPPHLLGAVPVLYSTELDHDEDDTRRGWTALLNAFLHPSMERFLYRAEHKLQDHKAQNPLLIFRNDGYSARVARTVAVKTYSSGPRGGVEGAKALAGHYGFRRMLTMDVGGTTTDVGLVEDGTVHARRRGMIEGVETSIELCDVTSAGVGGSSIFRVDGATIRVGPQSVGSTPGPACFGLGGTEATITDAFLVAGLLDPRSYFGGSLKLDRARAVKAIEDHVARALGVDVDAAVQAMEQAWVARVADTLRATAAADDTTVLAAFGGAGPLVACAVAEQAGIGRVIIPRLAAVFSAFGIGFSDVGHEFSQPVPDDEALPQVRERLIEQARRAMYAEGADLEDCRVEESLDSADGATRTLTLRAMKSVPHVQLTGRFGSRRTAATVAGQRTVSCAGERRSLPLYRVEDQPAGSHAAGPAVLEEAYFTCRVDPGWSFEINDAGDILLSRAPGVQA